MEAPEAFQVEKESEETKEAIRHGRGRHPRLRLAVPAARRLAERGVRYIQCTHSYKWDQHSDLFVKHNQNAKGSRQAIAGLLKDLKAKGLLKDTLVIWAGEFDARPFHKAAMDETTTHTDTPPGWRAAE